MWVKEERAFVVARFSDYVSMVEQFLKNRKWLGRAYVKQLPILSNHVEHCYSEDVVCVMQKKQTRKPSLLIIGYPNSIISCVLENKNIWSGIWRNETT